MINTANLSKTGESTQKVNGIPAGILTPRTHIEACADLKLQLPFFLRAGRKFYLKQLPNLLLVAISEHMEANHVAMEHLNKYQNYYQKLEAYIYCMWGFADGKSDFILVDGKWQISTPENFTCNKPKCNCSSWIGKELRINGQILSKNHAFMIKQIAKNIPDKTIAMNMGIAQSTYDYHKRNLLTLTGKKTRADLMVLALIHGIK